MGFTSADFDRLFEGSDDPWQFRSRWYEQRKRELTLACLPQRRYGSAYEPGCANGELSAALAARCDRLWVSDGSARAVKLAAARLATFEHVAVRQAWLPDQWPDERFDLIVLSELGYFMNAASLGELADCALASLAPGGTVLACHWRHPIAHGSLNGDDVHALIDQKLGLPRITRLVEVDFMLDVWCSDPRSTAQREGLV